MQTGMGLEHGQIRAGTHRKPPRARKGLRSVCSIRDSRSRHHIFDSEEKSDVPIEWLELAAEWEWRRRGGGSVMIYLDVH